MKNYLVKNLSSILKYLQLLSPQNLMLSAVLLILGKLALVELSRLSLRGQAWYPSFKQMFYINSQMQLAKYLPAIASNVPSYSTEYFQTSKCIYHSAQSWSVPSQDTSQGMKHPLLRFAPCHDTPQGMKRPQSHTTNFPFLGSTVQWQPWCDRCWSQWFCRNCRCYRRYVGAGQPCTLPVTTQFRHHCKRTARHRRLAGGHQEGHPPTSAQPA